MNRELCPAIGPRAVGLAGDEIGLQATRVPELGCVGDAACRPRPQAVLDALAPARSRSSPRSPTGPLNVNADDAAAALAVGLGAERILFLTDVPGVLRDELVLAHERTRRIEVEAGTLRRRDRPEAPAPPSSPRRTACRRRSAQTVVIA